jgi:hypothetical protein
MCGVEWLIEFEIEYLKNNSHYKILEENIEGGSVKIFLDLKFWKYRSAYFVETSSLCRLKGTVPGIGDSPGFGD